MKTFSSYKKKLFWLLYRSKLNEANKIKPIKFNYITNGHYHKVIKPLRRNPVTSTNETLIKINIKPSNFLDDIRDPLSNTNSKWFSNLSNSYIPTQVTNLIQLGDRFSLPTNHNKKFAVHEIIKDVESNSKSFYIENQIRLRNTIHPSVP